MGVGVGGRCYRECFQCWHHSMSNYSVAAALGQTKQHSYNVIRSGALFSAKRHLFILAGGILTSKCFCSGR